MRPPATIRRDLIGVLIGLTIGAILAFASARHFDFNRSANYGFGPEWNCTPLPKGGPVCIRKR